MTPTELAEAMQKYGVMIVIIAVVLFVMLVLLSFVIFMYKRDKATLNKMVDSVMKQNDILSGATKAPKKHQSDSATIYIRAMKSLESNCQMVHDLTFADRVAVYVFHNGTSSLSGFPFIKNTCIAEWVTLSVTYRKQSQEKDVSISTYTSLLYDLYKEGTIIYQNIDDMQQQYPIQYALHRSEGAKSIACVLIKDYQGKLLGYIRAEWMRQALTDDKVQTVKDELYDLSMKAASLLEFTSFEEISKYIGGLENGKKSV